MNTHPYNSVPPSLSSRVGRKRPAVIPPASAFAVLWRSNWSAQRMDDGARRMLTGRCEDMAADIEALARAISV